MTVESEVYSRLSGFGALTSLTSTRISHGERLQDEAVQAVLFSFIDRVAFHAMGATGTVRQARMQVDCFGANIDDAQAVAKQVFAALSRYSATAIVDIMLMSERDLSDLDDLDETQFRVSQDYRVIYNEQ